MNQPSNPQWTHQEPFDPMASMLPDEDYFIDLVKFDLNFPIFDNNGMEIQDGQQLPPQNQNPPHPESSANFNLDQYGDLSRMDTAVGDYSTGLQSQQGGSNGIDFGAQSSYQQANGSMQGTPVQNYPSHFNVPPTPNSAEMYPANMRYAHQQPENQAQWASEQQFQMRKDDVMASLTPLVSPHIPSNAHALHVLPEYTMPGAYLSPLGSPAIRPQPNNGQFPAYTPSRTADSSLAGSPIDLNFDRNNEPATSTDERPRKTRRKTANTKSSTSATRARQQTNLNQRRRDSLTINPPASGVSIDAQHSPVPRSGQGQASRGTSSKSNSPQPLAELRMAPPPRPGSVNNTPISLTGPNLDHILTQPPATPASLMRLRQQQQSGAMDMSPSGLGSELTSPVTGALGQSMEDLRLPEAASIPSDPTRNTPRIIMSDARSVHSTPAPMAISRTPGPQPILPSPAVSANGSKVENKGARGSRKRGSTNSTLVSPAIRPKISPSINPKLPEGSKSMANDTQVLLLASKSNYQNIIEGTTLPGVSYPAELSTNLTSKRTSHKIAEQGRRNRINLALQEMQSLLPTSPAFMAQARKEDGTPIDADVHMSDSPEEGSSTTKPTDAGCGSGSGGEGNGAPPSAGSRTNPLALGNQAQAGGGNSKAATVELAIDYIKHLNMTLADKESENERLRVELKALRLKCGGGGNETGNEGGGEGASVVVGAAGKGAAELAAGDAVQLGGNGEAGITAAVVA